jgi:hypothetical protein
MKRLLLIATLGMIVFIGLIVSKGGFRTLIDSVEVSSSLDLAVEVTPLRNDPNGKYGHIRITNLAKEAVTIKHVSINHSSQAACSFNANDANYLGETTVLVPGLGITVYTTALEAGLCGSVFVVTVDTDKGSAEYTISWR